MRHVIRVQAVVVAEAIQLERRRVAEMPLGRVPQISGKEKRLVLRWPSGNAMLKLVGQNED